MKLLAVLALVALAAASSRRHEQQLWHSQHVPTRQHVTEKEYEADKEYLYEYNGQLMTGLPGSSEQHSATRVQALVSLIFKTREEAYLKIQKIRFGYFNEKVANPRRVHTFDMFEQVPIEDELVRELELPLKFRYENGMISRLSFAESEQAWSSNIKRAILNMLQANIEKKHLTESEPRRLNSRYEELSSEIIEESQEMREMREQREKLFDFYTVIEKTIEGECEVAYTVTSNPSWEGRVQEQENIVNITKTINFDKCLKRPDVRYNFRFQEFCPACEESTKQLNQERMLRSSTIVKMNATMSEDRRRILIESARQESQYTYVPLKESDSIVQTYVNTTLQLIKSSRIESQQVLSHSLPKESDSDLVYTLDWDITKERFFREGENEFVDKTPYSQIKDKVAFVKTIMQKLVHYMRESVEEEAPRQFARLVKVMRMLKKNEIEQLFEHFYLRHHETFTKEEHKKIKSLFVDALALTATNDAVKVLVEKIEKKEIGVVKASFAIKKLQQTRVISEKMIEQLWKLTSEKYCKESPLTVCQSSYLTVGSLLNGLCSYNQDKLALYFKQQRRDICPRELKKQWVEKLFERFEKCDSELCRVTVLKTIGNAGLDLSFYPLEKIVKSPKYTQIVRVEAIFATRLLINIMPRKVEKMLMPIYMNKMEHSLLRMVSFHKIMKTKPEKFILDQLTRSLLNENNRQVASFVYTSLETYANSTDVCEKKMAKDLTLSLRHARYLPVKSWLQRSKFLRAQYQNKKDHRSLSAQFHSIMANSTIIPRHIATHFKLNMGAQFHGMDMSQYTFTLGMTQSHIEQYLRKLVRSYSHNFQDVTSTLEDMVEGRWSKEQTSPKFRKDIDEVFDELSIEEREYKSEEQSMALVYFRYMQQDYGFLPFTKEMLPEQFAEFAEKEMSVSKIVKTAKQLLSRGGEYSMPFDVQSASLLSEITRKIPTTIGMPLQVSTKAPVVAQARGNVVFQYNKESNKVELKLNEFKPSFVVSMVCKVEMWSPIVNTGLKWVAQTKVFAPFTGKLQITGQQQPEIKFVWQPEQKQHEIVRVQTRPMTTVLVWPKALQQWQEPEQKTIIGEQWNRVKNVRKSFGEKSLGVRFEQHIQWHETPEKHVKGTPAYFLAGPNKYTIRMQPGESMPREIEVIVTGKLFEKLTKASMSPKFNNFFEKSDEYLYERDESSSEESRERQMEQREKFDKYYKEYETVEPTQHQIKLLVQGKGASVERKAELTVDCQVESQSHKAAKCLLKIKRTPIPELETREWQMKSEIEFLFPETPRSIREVTAEKKFMLRVKSHWGTELNQDKYVDIKIVGEQSRLMEKLVKESLYGRHFEQKKWEQEERRSLFSPVAQYEQTKIYGMLDQYKVDVDYKKVPAQVKNITEKILSFAKYYYFWQTEENKQMKEQDSTFKLSREDEGQIRARINIDPKSRRYLNVSIEMPRERVFMKDIPLWTRFNALNMRRLSSPARNYYSLFVDAVSDYEQNICKVRTDRVSTFDEVKYRTPMSTCYSVIAKDCRQQGKFAVLMKRVEESSEKKELKIVAQHVKLIVKPKNVNSVENIELEYFVNGERKNINQLREILSHEHIVLRVTEEETGYCRIELPEAGLRVFFDGFAANIKVSPYYRQNMCGMCGQLEREIVQENCELRTARGECVSVSSKQQLKKLFQSFLYNKDCQMNERLYEEDSHYEFEPLQWEEEQRYQHIDEEYTRLSTKRHNEPIRHTRVIEQGHELCFSKQPVKKCPKYTHSIEWQDTIAKVVYTCIERNSYEAEEYVRRAHRGEVIEEIAELPASFTQNEHMPRKCVKTDF